MRYNQKYGHENLAHAVFQNLEMFQKYLTIGETMGYGKVTMKPIKYPQPEGPIATREVFNPALETRKIFHSLKEMGKMHPKNKEPFIIVGFSVLHLFCKK